MIAMGFKDRESEIQGIKDESWIREVKTSDTIANEEEGLLNLW